MDIAKTLSGNSDYSPSVRKFLAANGEKNVVNFLVCRAPVQSAISSVLNVISLGQFNAAEAGYDKFYHLSLVGTFEDGSKFSIEKLAQISIKTYWSASWGADFECEYRKAVA